MSHFTVMVFGDDVEAQLQPFHEFECTGINDEYVIDEDVTEELQARIDDGEHIDDALSWYGLEDKVVSDESEVDTEGDECEHKYGYAIVKDGDLIKAVNRTNPDRKWDWYQVGGRWSGFLKLKEGAVGENGERSWMNSGEKTESGFCDSAMKGDIDIEGMRNATSEEASNRWDLVNNASGGVLWESWKSVRDRVENIDEARDAYNGQEILKKLRSNEEVKNLLFWDDDQYLKSKEDYVKEHRDSAISTFAVLKDGVWYERGEMGWWGCVSDEKDQDSWNSEIAKLIDSVSDDTRITIVDCHI